jgi:hypothetical protein
MEILPSGQSRLGISRDTLFDGVNQKHLTRQSNTKPEGKSYPDHGLRV